MGLPNIIPAYDSLFSDELRLLTRLSYVEDLVTKANARRQPRSRWVLYIRTAFTRYHASTQPVIGTWQASG